MAVGTEREGRKEERQWLVEDDWFRADMGKRERKRNEEREDVGFRERESSRRKSQT